MLKTYIKQVRVAGSTTAAALTDLYSFLFRMLTHEIIVSVRVPAVSRAAESCRIILCRGTVKKMKAWNP